MLRFVRFDAIIPMTAGTAAQQATGILVSRTMNSGRTVLTDGSSAARIYLVAGVVAVA